MERITIDMSKVASVADVHEVIKNSLKMPDYYGCNLDALYDVLTSYEGDDVEVVLVGLDSADEELNKYLGKVQMVMTDASAQNEGRAEGTGRVLLVQGACDSEAGQVAEGTGADEAEAEVAGADEDEDNSAFAD